MLGQQSRGPGLPGSRGLLPFACCVLSQNEVGSFPVAVFKDHVEALAPAVGIMCSGLLPVISLHFQTGQFPEDLFNFKVRFKVFSWCPALTMKQQNNLGHG